MKLETEDLRDYLAPTEVIDSDEKSIRTKALEIVSEADDDVEQARRLFEWVRDAIPHTNDLGAEVVTCTASEVLRAGTGICYAKSHLLAALCRAIDLPAGFCYQRLQKDPPHEGFELHGFNAIYLRSLRRWVRVDARGNKPGVDARFSVDEECLAFPVDTARGETTDATIYVEPLPTVIATLRAHSRLSTMWPELPAELPGNE